MAIIMIVALVIIYFRQNIKMQSCYLKELYKCKDMGEGLLNFFGSLYIPVVFFLLSYVCEEYKLFIYWTVIVSVNAEMMIEWRIHKTLQSSLTDVETVKVRSKHIEKLYKRQLFLGCLFLSLFLNHT